MSTELKTIIAKSLKGIDLLKDGTFDVQNPLTDYRLHFVDAETRERTVFVTKSVAMRIKTRRENQNFSVTFNLYQNKDGIVVDYDSEPKDSNLPLSIEADAAGNDSKEVVILERTRAGTLFIRHKVGVAADLAQAIKTAAEKHIKEHGNIRAYDILNDQFFVADVRNADKFIYVKPEAV